MTQIRMNATMTQNVVTYTVVVTTDNSSGKLLPYLTANVQFEVDQRSDVLLVPNAALRWKPQASQIDPAAGKTATGGRVREHPGPRLPMGRNRGGLVRPLEVVGGHQRRDDDRDQRQRRKGGGAGHRRRGRRGRRGGQDTEATADGDKTSNPFLPKLPKGSRPPPGPMM